MRLDVTLVGRIFGKEDLGKQPRGFLLWLCRNSHSPTLEAAEAAVAFRAGLGDEPWFTIIFSLPRLDPKSPKQRWT